MTDHGDGHDARDGDPGDPEAIVRAYYAALDAGAYGDLRALLTPGFVQRRPDRTFEGRDAFVAFMRDDRPRTDTTHAVDAVYERVGAGDDGGTDGQDGEAADNDDAGAEFAVRGRLVGADGTDLFEFVDAHRFEGDRVAEIRTYTR